MACAQIADYLGPGVASTGAGTIGQRSGQDLSIRMFGGINAIRDTGLVPFATDSTGKLANVKSLYGTEVNIGAYGAHLWRRVRLGLDYSGGYRRYTQSTSYNGTNQGLTLGVTYQQSKRIVLDSQLSAATVNQGSQLVGIGSGIVDGIASPTSLLFDNRYIQVQVGTDVNYIASAKTVYSFGGTGYTIHRGTSALAGVNGYTLRGNVKHRLSRSTTVVVGYQHTHYDYPRSFGEADINQFTSGISKRIGRDWDVSLSGGAYQIQTQGVESVAVDPAIAALLGTATASRTFYKVTWLPTIAASINRTFRRSTWSANYSRGTSPGNGLYLASQQESYGSGYSYTGIRKWSLSISVNRSTLSSVAQLLSDYESNSASASISRTLPYGLHLSGEFQLRQQKLALGGFNRTGTRTSINLSYSPGDIPISFH
ncbi:MAG: hypothetical protein ABI824_09590 [Acidobacteriota bacterium]